MWTTFTGSGGAPMASTQSSGVQGTAGPGGWHPTVLYLAGLVVLEVLAAGFLIRLVK
jgi:hypothetical protein